MPLPRGTVVTLDSAWAAYRSDRIARADSAFRQVVAQCPREPSALTGLGYVAMRQGAIDEARRAFVGALAEGPDGYDALTGMGMAAYRQGDTQGARDAFRRAAVLFPKDSLVQVYNRPWKPVAHDDPRWDSLRVETNRARVGRDGTVYLHSVYERNRLRFARQSETTLADWFADPRTGVIEARIPWGMLQVSDPSSRLVLSGMEEGGTGPASSETDGFRFVVQRYDPRSPASGGALLGCGAPLEWSWNTWETPAWYEEVKPLFGAMQQTFRAITGPVARRAAP